MTADARRDRLEVEDIRDKIDRLRSRTTPISRFVGIVAGTPPVSPTAMPVYVKVNPATVTGNPTEGGAGTVTAMSRECMVAVLGTKLPVVGDQVLCRLVGGRWVTETCGGGGSILPTDCSTCCPGNPPAPLTLTDANATFTLAFVGSVPIYQWGGGYLLPQTGVDTAGSSVYTTGSINMSIGYIVNCNIGVFVQEMVVNRIWKALSGNGAGNISCPGDTPTYYYIDSTLDGVGNLCSPSAYINPFGQSKQAHLTVTGCLPLTCTGGTFTGTNVTPDPVGGGVTLTSTPREMMKRWLDDPDPARRRHARYKLRMLDNPDEPPGVLYADGRYVPGDARSWTPPTPEDLALRSYLEKHGGCCGG